MKRILAFIILCLYTLTSTGATVYIHQCANVFFIKSFQEDLQDTGNCPHCHSSNEALPLGDSSASCHVNKASCCSDFKVDLKKSNDQSELSVNSLNLPSGIIPSLITLYWIPTAATGLLASASIPLQKDAALLCPPIPPYLLHCTFRI